MATTAQYNSYYSRIQYLLIYYVFVDTKLSEHCFIAVDSDIFFQKVLRYIPGITDCHEKALHRASDFV